jgi:hypothetical protein
MAAAKVLGNELRGGTIIEQDSFEPASFQGAPTLQALADVSWHRVDRIPELNQDSREMRCTPPEPGTVRLLDQPSHVSGSFAVVLRDLHRIKMTDLRARCVRWAETRDRSQLLVLTVT